MKPKVLVVDDEPETLGLLNYVLCGEGFEVATASNGHEALAKARDLCPDVVLLDVHLPEMDGFAVCESLRAQAVRTNLPVVLFTNYYGPSIVARGLKAGSQFCLKKADGIEAVVRSLRQAVENETALRAERRHGAVRQSGLQRPRSTAHVQLVESAEAPNAGEI